MLKIGFKLSNYGDTLKLMIPSYVRKYVSGQSNFLGTVTTHEIERNEMGNRVTKSKTLDSLNKEYNSVFVKVQRADGS